MATEKAARRHKMLMEAVWEAYESRGGITVSKLSEATGISSYQMFTALWTLVKRGMLRAEWLPSGKGRGAIYAVLPGPRAWKVKSGMKAKKPREVKTPKKPESAILGTPKTIVLTPEQEAYRSRLLGRPAAVQS